MFSSLVKSFNQVKLKDNQDMLDQHRVQIKEQIDLLNTDISKSETNTDLFARPKKSLNDIAKSLTSVNKALMKKQTDLEKDQSRENLQVALDSLAIQLDTEENSKPEFKTELDSLVSSISRLQKLEKSLFNQFKHF